MRRRRRRDGLHLSPTFPALSLCICAEVAAFLKGRPPRVGKSPSTDHGVSARNGETDREDAMHHVSAMPQDLMEAEFIPTSRWHRFAPEPGEVRCECLVCSAHAFAFPDVEGSRRCGNCGSHELKPLGA